MNAYRPPKNESETRHELVVYSQRRATAPRTAVIATTKAFIFETVVPELGEAAVPVLAGEELVLVVFTCEHKLV